MEVKVGDRVKFLNSVGGGKVVKLNNESTVMVLTDDDWEMPMLKKELIVVEQPVAPQRPKRNNEAEVPPAQVFVVEKNFVPEEKDDSEINIYLAFVPLKEETPHESDLEAYLINDSNYFALYSILSPMGDKFLAKTGLIEPNTKVLTETLSRLSLQRISKYAFQLILFKKTAFDSVPPIDKEVKINTVKFFKEKSYKENDFFEENCIMYTVVEDKFEKRVAAMSEEDIKRIIAEKEIRSADINQPKTFKKATDPATIEDVVDLHIHELLDDYSQLKPKEIVDLQMNKFRETLKSAIERRIKSITFIHGIGNGTLKFELRRELDKSYARYQYQDASFREYGFGATMVLIAGR